MPGAMCGAGDGERVTTGINSPVDMRFQPSRWRLQIHNAECPQGFSLYIKVIKLPTCRHAWAEIARDLAEIIYKFWPLIDLD